MNLLWLGDPQSFDPMLVGGKAANLSRLARMAYRVPDGFCLPVAVVEQAHPHELKIEITRAISDLMACHSLAEFVAAVRSSAVGEDGAAVSFAGQYDSFLNVVGPEAILEAIRRCWDSADSSHALEYRRRQGLPARRNQMAVLVHQLVPADVSAVVFSANPITWNSDEILINACWGLGESIVGGTVTPDAYTVRKTGLGIFNRLIAEKKRMTILVAGGTRQMDVPRFLRREPSLNDEQVLALAQMAISLEKTMGCPVDVECAYASGELYLLQCRPISAMERRREIQDKI